ncbi:PREDICTED: uncharacterized protein LOC105457809 [Wasmannia auropunctata]|uniref:uncharacterized protein LOC105457809 n=1 Tax=Wasmannia auropunctata TaxID=64793 RepID=UPI0005EECD3A|nr:PREDICTED: uncharacterized protein LOC105457809 [Wasmannia auropunctata]
METRERVSNFAVKEEPNEICEEKICVRDSIDRGKVIVVVSPTETKPLASSEHLKSKKSNNNMSFLNVISSMHSLVKKNFDNDDDDDKKNITIKPDPDEPKQSCRNREVDKIFPRQRQRTQTNRSPRRKSTGISTLLCIDGNRLTDAVAAGIKRKIPRPANAFMLFANEWRRKLAAENPRESNKDISVRLGVFWKNMSKDVKEKYFALAREVDREHKRKYPDYVYNPKEARLRKAMREQTRELSRRSILQSAIANANARTAAIGGANSVVSASMAGGFLNQHHRFDCTSMPMGPNVSPHQAAEPWFQAAHRLKSAHSPRIGNWYGNVCGDPIERLQAMGVMHQHQQQQQQQQQQRDLEKSIKDQRNHQAAECAAAAFSSNGYSPDIAAAEREIRRQEPAEYADFVDGQKWHPYQSSASPHPLPRTPHPSPQMGGVLHPNVQNTNAHGHNPWGQFCHSIVPHVSSVARNAMIRGPRHAVFLRDRTPTRHCAFLEDASPMNYAPSKLNVDSIRAAYPPSEHQMPRLLGSTVDPVTDSTTINRREEDGGTRWEPNNARMSLDELVPTSTEGTVSREKERESRHSSERFELKKKPVSKQPLPGFHQAFGSTEIGRFSRSEFFVNMVGESSGSGSGATADDGDGTDGGDDGDLIPEAYLTTPLLFPFSPKSHDILGANAIHGFTEDGRLVSRILPNECCWFTQTGHAITRIPDGFVTCAALVDYFDQRKWQDRATIPHPMEFPMLFGSRGMSCSERIISDRAQRNYTVISADETRDHDIRRERETVNLKINRNKNSFVDSSTHESEKKN